jgi:phosphomannomutase
MKVRIGDLMKTSGVGFGTSGARGLAEKMTDMVCYAYTKGFLQYLMSKGEIEEGHDVLVAGDLRPSTDRIMVANAQAATDMNFRSINGGKVPSPASAYYGIKMAMPVVNVTGSHIPVEPEERNGVKFNKVAGEVLKSDEQPIKDQVVEIPMDLFDENGMFVKGTAGEMSAVEREVEDLFVKRVVDFFGEGALEGKRIGLYQHSAVGRDMFHRMLVALGADVTLLGRSEKFIPVDTEAIRPEDVELAKGWAAEYKFDAIVSTDGDSDRPLLAGRDGKWLRGDVLGILAAKFLGADSISAPVSCNTALEKSGFFKHVNRTKIGSPYVIDSMNQAKDAGYEKVVSYEANGGFLTATDFTVDGRTLEALPTRDAFVPIIAAILLADKEGFGGVEELVASLPQRFTASDRHKEFPTERSREILAMFNTGDWERDKATIEKYFGEAFGELEGVDYTDGVRMTFRSGNIVHLRPSGNAPEFRVYTEAETEEAAQKIDAIGMEIVGKLREAA